jgi:hypothetical protein
MAGSIPTFDPWFPPRGGNALPFALSPLQERAVVTFMDSVEVPWGLSPEVGTWENAWAPPGTYGFGWRLTRYVGCIFGSLLLLALMGAGFIGMLLDVWKSTHP